MNQDSTINNITTTQNIIQAITNTDVPPTSKENTKNKSDIANEVNTVRQNLENRINQMKMLTLKENQS